MHICVYPRTVSSLRSSVDGRELHRCVSKCGTKTRNSLDPPFVGLLMSQQRNDKHFTDSCVWGALQCSIARSLVVDDQVYRDTFVATCDCGLLC